MDSRKKARIRQKIEAYRDIVEKISTLSASSTLKVGCMALRKNFTKIASFGYNGSYRNSPILNETGTEEESLEPGKSGFIHSELNMAIKFREHDPENYIILLTHSPCKDCTKVLINAGFLYIYWIHEYRIKDHFDIFDYCGVKYGNIEKLIEDYEEILAK